MMVTSITDAAKKAGIDPVAIAMLVEAIFLIITAIQEKQEDTARRRFIVLGRRLNDDGFAVMVNRVTEIMRDEGKRFPRWAARRQCKKVRAYAAGLSREELGAIYDRAECANLADPEPEEEATSAALAS